MTCDFARLQASLDDALTAIEQQQLTDHLETCASCRQELDTLRRLETEVQQSMEPLMQLPPLEINVDNAWQRFVQHTLHDTEVAAHLEELLPAHTDATSPAPTPPATLSNTKSPRTSGSRTPGFAWFTWLGALAAAAFLLIHLPNPWRSSSNTLMPQTRSSKAPHTRRGVMPPHTRPQARRHVSSPMGTAKGIEVKLFHACRTQSTIHKCPTHPGAALTPGALIQFTYQLPQNSHVMVVSINQQGKVSLFVPFGKGHSMPLSSTHGTLPRGASLELDDYLGHEKIFFFSATKAFTFAQVKLALQAHFAQHKSLSKLETVPGPWRTKHFLITKQRPPSQSP